MDGRDVAAVPIVKHDSAETKRPYDRVDNHVSTCLDEIDVRLIIGGRIDLLDDRRNPVVDFDDEFLRFAEAHPDPPPS